MLGPRIDFGSTAAVAAPRVVLTASIDSMPAPCSRPAPSASSSTSEGGNNDTTDGLPPGGLSARTAEGNRPNAVMQATPADSSPVLIADLAVFCGTLPSPSLGRDARYHDAPPTDCLHPERRTPTRRRHALRMFHGRGGFRTCDLWRVKKDRTRAPGRAYARESVLSGHSVETPKSADLGSFRGGLGQRAAPVAQTFGVYSKR